MWGVVVCGDSRPRLSAERSSVPAETSHAPNGERAALRRPVQNAKSAGFIALQPHQTPRSSSPRARVNCGRAAL
jgi:hypothetical protein